MKQEVTFNGLVESIRTAHLELSAHAGRAVNISLTLRNWLIGFYIEEYERKGLDRAEYGEKWMDRLSDLLNDQAVPRCDRRELYRYRQFYLTYPQIVQALPAQFQKYDIQSLVDNEGGDSPIVESVTPQSGMDGRTLVSKLSFTHLNELFSIDDPTQRAFYEMECIRGNWSVRELKRQIGSLYYERSGLSKDKGKLSELTRESAESAPALAIRDPYVFEFLGLKPAEVMSESHLETQLTDRIREFLLELGHGFCFEARQKRILIGDEHFFVDLVFYHRVLKCHVLVDLKLEPFTHENLGQLNTYVNWYRRNMMTEGDNPPVGLLLCTDKNHALAEYALAGMDNQMFVSKYQLELPKKEEMQRFIDAQLREVGE